MKPAFPGDLKREARHRIRDPSSSGTSSPSSASGNGSGDASATRRPIPFTARCVVMMLPVVRPIIGQRAISGFTMAIAGVGAQGLIRADTAAGLPGRVLSVYGLTFRAGPVIGAL